MAGYGDMPFGLRDVKLTHSTLGQVDLPAAQTLKFGERMRSGELSGDDKLQAVVSFSEAVEWELEAGGISLEAYSVLTGRTSTTSGTTPNRSYYLSASAQQAMPYVKIYGKALGASTDDVHCKIFKAKVTSIEGTFSDGEFWVTSCKGLAIDDGTNGIFQFIQNETAANLPAT